MLRRGVLFYVILLSPDPSKQYDFTYYLSIGNVHKAFHNLQVKLIIPLLIK